MSEKEKPLTRKEVVDIVVERMKAVSARTSHSPAFQVFQMQNDATLTQASAVSGSFYEVLATTQNARIISIAALDDWSVDTTTLQVHITIDGLTYTFTNDPNDNTWYSCNELDASLAPGAQVLSATLTDVYPFLLEGRNVRVQVESTGGTSDSLQARVRYAMNP